MYEWNQVSLSGNRKKAAKNSYYKNKPKLRLFKKLENNWKKNKTKQKTKNQEKREKEKWRVGASWKQIKDERITNKLRAKSSFFFMVYLDKGSGCITGSHYSAQCTELHRGPVEDWCRFEIGPAFLLHMFCYICSKIPTQSNYHSLLFEQKKGNTQSN